MTDRINALTVVLDQDLRDDDCAPLIVAIEQLRGVRTVQAHVVGSADFIAMARVRTRLAQRLQQMAYELLREEGPS